MFQQHLNTSRRAGVETEAGEAQPGGAAALLSWVQRKGEGSAAPSRGPSRTRLRLPAKLAPLSDLRSSPPKLAGLWVELLRSRSWGVTPPTRLFRPTFAWDIRSGRSAGGDDACGCADGKRSAGHPDARASARRAPARDGLQEDEIWKVMIYSVD